MSTAPSQSPDRDSPVSGWRQLVAALPMRLALAAVAVVWVLGCVWSFQEQTEFAAAKGFALPRLLPLVIDGFAVAMAGVSWAASLDARPAVSARTATLIAVAASSASNGTWAWLRTDHDPVAVALGTAVPLAANLAFEVLLAELRRQVQRSRGLPAPVAVPYPRLIRLVLAPGRTFTEWRVHVLELTELAAATQPAMPVAAPSTETAAAAPVRVPAQLLVVDQEVSPSGSAEGPPAEVADPVEPAPPTPPAPRRRPTPVPAAATQRQPGPRRSDAERLFEARVRALADKLRTHPAPDAVPGGAVGELLGEDLNDRTGRRLLVRARAAVQTDPFVTERQADPAPLGGADATWIPTVVGAP
jgi:hypothetical protein